MIGNEYPHRIERQSLSVLLIVAPLFFMQPSLTLLLIFVIGGLYSQRSYWLPEAVSIFGAAYLGLINTTKVPVSDLERYYEWYVSAQGFNLFEYLAVFSREPIFYSWMWVVSQLSNGDCSIFIFLSTGISYFLIGYSVTIVSRHHRVNEGVIALIILMIFFLPPLFSISALVVRQFMAAALVVLFFAKRIVDRKTNWWIIFCAILIHYSAAIFLILASIRRPRRFSPMLAILVSSITLFIIFILSKQIAGALVQLPLVGLIFHRVAAEEIPDVVGLTVNALVYAVMFLFVAYVNVIRKSSCRNVGDSDNALLQNYNMAVLLLSLFVIASGASVNTAEVAMRFYFYLYCFTGLTIAIFVCGKSWVSPYLLAIVTMEIFVFFLSLGIGVWEYAPVTNIILMPVPQLWGAVM